MVKRIHSVQSNTKHIVKRRLLRNRKMIMLLLFCMMIGSLNELYFKQGDWPLQSAQQIRVYNTEDNTLMKMDLETYIVGVVAAEMPASFELEALKAQAVAARTFAVNRINHPNEKVTMLHPEAQITTSPNTCQAWIDDAEQRERWGSSYETWHKKIMQAVSETAGEVLYYNEMLIEPVYHASCGGGTTEAAEDVWGNAKPYLVSVFCNHPTDKHSDNTTLFSLEELIEKMNLRDSSTETVKTMQDDYISVIETTGTNRVKKLRIGNDVFSGGELRSMLGLKSTLIDWYLDDEEITFTTSGYGHGVGMCQHGADYYARQGYDYRQILQHYYSGTTLQQLS